MLNRRYDEEFKNNCVELLLTSGKPLKPMARELGVSDSALRKWRDAYLERMEGNPSRPPGGSTPREMAAEIRQLHKDLHHIKRQRDILKKALGILSDPSQGGMP